MSTPMTSYRIPKRKAAPSPYFSATDAPPSSPPPSLPNVTATVVRVDNDSILTQLFVDYNEAISDLDVI